MNIYSICRMFFNPLLNIPLKQNHFKGILVLEMKYYIIYFSFFRLENWIIL